MRKLKFLKLGNLQGVQNPSDILELLKKDMPDCEIIYDDKLWVKNKWTGLKEYLEGLAINIEHGGKLGILNWSYLLCKSLIFTISFYFETTVAMFRVCSLC